MELVPSSLKKTDSIHDIEDQIKVLATNIEVLNQKLIADPNAAITPGEAIIQKKMNEALEKLKKVEEGVHSSDKSFEKELIVRAEDLSKKLKADTEKLTKNLVANINHLSGNMLSKTDEMSGKLQNSAHHMDHTLKHVTTVINTIPDEKKALKEEIKKLDNSIEDLSKINRKWLGNLFLKLDILNGNMKIINQSVVNLYNYLDVEFHKKIEEVGNNTSTKIFKNLAWVILAIAVVSAIFSLIFAKLFM